MTICVRVCLYPSTIDYLKFIHVYEWVTEPYMLDYNVHPDPNTNIALVV